jgi:hypothetical protein
MMVIQVETETKNRPEPKYLRAMKVSNDILYPYEQTPIANSHTNSNPQWQVVQPESDERPTQNPVKQAGF